eukprot:5681571-Ditylum_brightwellii.AAC.1
MAEMRWLRCDGWDPIAVMRWLQRNWFDFKLLQCNGSNAMAVMRWQQCDGCDAMAAILEWLRCNGCDAMPGTQLP